jgi:cold-inducible RNA-binding protein
MLRLFVGNIPHTCDESSLSQWFEERGHAVGSAQVIRDQITGHSRGFAFVELGSASELSATLAEFRGQAMSGRVLTINAATPKLPRGQQLQPQQS